jgi:hypothetical protein
MALFPLPQDYARQSCPPGQFVNGMASVFLMPTVGSFASGMVSKLLLHGANTGFVAGLVSGATSGFVTGFVEGAGNAYLAGQSNIGRAGFRSGLGGAAFGGILGGISGGIQATSDGRNFFSGEYNVEQGDDELFASVGYDLCSETIPDRATLFNSRHSSFDVYYKTESGYYGMRGNRVRPGHFITQPFDGVATPLGFSRNSVYRVSFGGRVRVDACGEVFDLPRTTQSNWRDGVKTMAGHAMEVVGGAIDVYGWTPRAYFVNNDLMKTIPGIGQGWQELFDANSSYRYCRLNSRCY